MRSRKRSKARSSEFYMRVQMQPFGGIRMKKILLATVATIPFLTLTVLPGAGQELNKQRGGAGVSQSQAPGAGERRGETQGKELQGSSEQNRTSGEAENKNKVNGDSSPKERGAQAGSEGRANQAAEQAGGQSNDRGKQAQDQIKAKSDQSKTTGQAGAKPKQEESAGAKSKGQVSEDQKKGTSGQKEQDARGAQDRKQDKSGPAQTTGQAARPDNDRNERAQQGNGRDQNTQKDAKGESRGGETGGRVTLNDEQRTRVEKEVFSGRDVPRVDHVDFSLNVGVEVPERIRVVEVPSVLIDIHPEWRGDEYFVVNDEIVIVDHSRRVVAMVPVGSSSASVTRTTTVGSAGGADIREIQQVLIEKGYYHGRVDGVMGRETEEALMQFQRREGIEATGRIDERTTAALGISGRSEGRGGQEQGREQSDQRQGQSQPAKEPSTSGRAGDRDDNARQGTDLGKGAQDRDQKEPAQTKRPSTSGQANHADDKNDINKDNDQRDNARGAQDRDKEGQRSLPSTSGQGGTQDRSSGQSARPSQNGGNDSRRKP